MDEEFTIYDDEDAVREEWASGITVDGEGRVIVVGGGRTDDHGWWNHPHLILMGFAEDRTTEFSRRVAVGAYRDDTEGNTAPVAHGGDGGFVFVSHDEEVLVRVRRDGTLDLAGVAPLPFGVSAVAVQQNGKIVVAGTVWTGPQFGDGRAAAVARFNADGTLDTSFGEGGIVKPHIDGTVFISSGTVAPDGSIVVGGSRKDLLDGNTYDSVLIRLHGDRVD